MRTIWKWELRLLPTQEIEVPENTEILSVQRVGAGITASMCMWGKVNTENRMVKLTIDIFETGKPAFEPHVPRVYLATLQYNEGGYIVHVFRRDNHASLIEEQKGL